MGVYAIEENFMETLEKKLNRIINKCKRNGNNFVYRKVGEEMRENEKRDIYSGKIIKEYHRFVLVEVEGTAKVGNYECVAVLEIHSSGNIIRRINFDGEIPERFRSTGNYCEHCRSKRQRNELYIVRNVETNEFLQVGKSCLMEYTNGMDSEVVAAWLDGISELETLDGYLDDNMAHVNPYFSIEEVLCYTQEVVSKMGYFNSQCSLPTKHIVQMLICGGYVKLTLTQRIENVNKDLKSHHFQVRFSKEDFLFAETMETVNRIIEYYKALEDRSEFVSNIKVILNDGYVSMKNIGFLCYLPQGYAKAMEREVERAKRVNLDKDSAYFGEIKKRYKSESVFDFRCVAAVDTDYGEKYIYKIVLENGSVLIWKTNKFICEDEMQKTKHITFTVKDHNEYKDCRQTEITRAVLEK